MKKILLLIVLLMNINAYASSFVKGVQTYKVYKPSLDENNAGITYNYQGRNLKVQMFYYQIGVVARLIDEYGNKKDLRYNDPYVMGETDRFASQYNNIEYVITQYDFDADRIDEIVIAARIKDGTSTPVGIYIYRIKDNFSWNLIAPQTWWNMTVTLHVNHIKVESNKYGFTYDWAYEKDQFVDYGDY